MDWASLGLQVCLRIIVLLFPVTAFHLCTGFSITNCQHGSTIIHLACRPASFESISCWFPVHAFVASSLSLLPLHPSPRSESCFASFLDHRYPSASSFMVCTVPFKLPEDVNMAPSCNVQICSSTHTWSLLVALTTLLSRGCRIGTN